MSKAQAEIRTLKVNRYILVEEEPCKIISIETSKPGKHGECKARITAIRVFDGQKRSIVHPVTHTVWIPMIDKRAAQVLSITGEEVQLMDLETYETFNVPLPKDDAEKAKVIPTAELKYIDAMGRRMITFQ